MAEIRVEIRKPIIFQGGKDGKIYYILILSETGGKRTCSMCVIYYNFHLIKVMLNSGPVSKTPFNLISDILKRDGASIVKVVVDRLVDESYLGSIYIKRASGAVYKLDAVPPDAVIMALLNDCPIFVEDSLLVVDEWADMLLNRAKEAEDEKALLKPASDVSQEQLLDILYRFKEDKSKKPN